MNIKKEFELKFDDDIKNSIELRFGGNVKRLIHEALILYEGWEMDNRGWIVEMEDGSILGFTTNHGGVCKWPSIQDTHSQ